MSNATFTAEKLLGINAVQLSPDKPYIWASGWKSPIYCDNRKVLSHPYIRDHIKSELCNVVFEKFKEAELVVGVATAGIAWGAMVADQLKLPFVYVRPKPKEHGLGNQIEGEYSIGQKVVIIEDLISTGKSSLQVAEVLRSVEVEVLGMVSIFNYCFSTGKEAFDNARIKLYSLTDYPSLLQVATSKGILKEGQEEVLLKWRADPANWTGIS